MNLQAIRDAHSQFDRLEILVDAKATEEEIAAQASRTVTALVLAQHELNGHHKVEVDVEKVAPRAIDLLAEDDPPKAWVVDGLLEEECRMLLHGPSYVGKSLAATMAAICVARGFGGVLNHGVDAPPANVVLFYGEGSRRQVKNMVRKLLGGEPCPDTLRLVEVHAQDPVPDLASAHGRAWYEAVLAALKPRLVVLDTSTSLVFGDRSKAEVAQSVMNWLSQMGRKHGAAFIVVHHVRKGSAKGDDGSPADKAYGAQEWTALADTAVELVREGEKGVRVHAWKIKDEAGDDPYIGAIDPTNLRIEFVAKAGPKRAAEGTGPEPSVTPYQVLELIRDLGELTRREIEERLNVSRDTVRRRTTSSEFTGWMQQGIVVRTEASGRTPESFRFVGPMPS